MPLPEETRQRAMINEYLTQLTYPITGSLSLKDQEVVWSRKRDIKEMLRN